MNTEISASVQPVSATPDASLVSYTHIIYALHAASVVIGLTSAAFVVTAFIFGLPSIVAVIMNYARRNEVRGTFLESHFRWQIRTFWFALLWCVVIAAVAVPLMVMLVGFFILPLSIALLGIWVIYRVARGWLRLKEGLPMAV
jgi:uncharacterized membrane protein